MRLPSCCSRAGWLVPHEIRVGLSRPDATIPAAVLTFFMALPFLVESTPRAYRLKAGNADFPISTSFGTFPSAPPTRRESNWIAHWYASDLSRNINLWGALGGF
jgi:hypothetical protein